MKSDVPFVSVAELEACGVLLVQDGNHGEYRPRPDEFAEDGTPFIRAADIVDGQVAFDRASRINDVALARIRKGIGRPGDVLLSHKGTVGRVAFAPLDCELFVCSPQTTFWRSLDHGRLDRTYLFAYLRSPVLQRQLVSVMHESDMAPYVSLTVQRSLNVRLPPIDKQRRIAGVVGALDDKIDAEWRKRQHFDVVLRVQGLHLVRSGAGEWPIERLGAHYSTARGLSYTGAGLGDRSTGVPLHNLNSVLEGGGYKFEGIKYYSGEYRERHLVLPGDLVVANTEQGFDELLIAYPAIIPSLYREHGIYSHHLHRITPLATSHLSRYWLYVWLLDRASHELIAGYANGTTVNMLPVAALEDPLMAIPPVERVRQLDSIVAPLLAGIEQSVREATRLISIRDTLLPKLVSGQLRVPQSYDPDDVLGTLAEKSAFAV